MAPVGNVGRKLAGLAVALGAGYFMVNRWGMYRGFQGFQKDMFVRNNEYQLRMGNHGRYSFNPRMDKWAEKVRWQMTFGPWNLNTLWVQTKNNIKDFFGFFGFLTRPESLFAIGGLYLAGLKPHKLITAPTKFLWDNKIIQGFGSILKSAFLKCNILTHLAKPLKFLLTTGPGLLITGAATWLGYRFMRVYDGTEQWEVMRGLSDPRAS